MPIHKTSTGKWKYGTTGKEYPTRKQALIQMRAIKASEAREKKKSK